MDVGRIMARSCYLWSHSCYQISLGSDILKKNKNRISGLFLLRYSTYMQLHMALSHSIFLFFEKFCVFHVKPFGQP